MTNKINEYRGYSLFNDVEDAALRTWNRCVVLFKPQCGITQVLV